MANLAKTLRIFQSGVLSDREFLAQIDRALASDQASPARLLEILQEEHTNFPLPPEMFSEVRKRIEGLTEGRAAADDEETRVQAASAQPPPAAQSRAAAGNPAPADAGPERIKGVGDTLNGRFVLEECLGFGGMGMVYKALDLRKLEASDRNPYIAIKVLNVQFRGHPKSLIALQREAKKAQRLAHPNIVTVYDFDRDGSMVYLTMEYLVGRPMSQLLGSPGFKGLPYPAAMRIVTGISRALDYAHERGFVHCDLKPANVFITDQGDVKVIDFGIARVFQKPEQESEATVFDPGSLGGLTPAYASPEMIEHREPDPRDDIYALACIAYELLTGRHPYGRQPATQARNAGMRPPRPRGLGMTQWRTLRKALSFERDQRTASVMDFLHGMTGESRTMTYLALTASSFLVAGLLAAALVYFWDIRPDSEPRAAPPPTAKAPPAPTLAAVRSALAGIPCTALAPTLKGDVLELEGYAPRSLGPAKLRGALASLPGIKALKTDLIRIGDDQCPVVEAFAPYWAGQRQGGKRTSIHTRAPRGELSEGDPLVLEITTPAYDSYVNVDYYVLDGTVVHLVPSPRAPDNQAPPNYSATIGGLGNWVISRPFGKELIVLLTTPVPLFDGLRPENEARPEYLRAVAERLRQIAGKYGAEKITADFVLIDTRARK